MESASTQDFICLGIIICPEDDARGLSPRRAGTITVFNIDPAFRQGRRCFIERSWRVLRRPANGRILRHRPTVFCPELFGLRIITRYDMKFCLTIHSIAAEAFDVDLVFFEREGYAGQRSNFILTRYYQLLSYC